MKNIFAVFIIAINIIILPNVLAEELSAKAIEKDIRKLGPKKVCMSLYDDLNKWYELQSNIIAGDKEWLKLAGRLHAGAEGSAGEMLSLSVGEALEQNPENVFKYTLGNFTIPEICGGPDTEDVRYNTYELVIGAIDKRMQKVSSVKEADLQEKREECLQYLSMAKIATAEMFQIDEQDHRPTAPAASNETKEGDEVKAGDGVKEVNDAEVGDGAEEENGVEEGGSAEAEGEVAD